MFAGRSKKSLIVGISAHPSALWDIVLVRFNDSGVGRLLPGHSDPISLPVSAAIE